MISGLIYEPSEEIEEKMKAERVNLTPARAMLLIMLNDLVRNGEFVSMFAAEKLIYFLQRFGAADIFRVGFKPYHYGPYSGGKVAHLLYTLNGSYIKGMRGMDLRPFEYIWMVDNDDAVAIDYLSSLPNSDHLMRICNQTQDFLQGFYSNYTLELLSTVDYILTTTPSLQGWQLRERCAVLDEVTLQLHNWSERKEKMFTRPHLEMALDHLMEYEALIEENH